MDSLAAIARARTRLAEALARWWTRIAVALARWRACIAVALARWRACIAVALARRRVALGFAFGVLVLVLAQPTRTSLAIGLAVAACGEALRVWAAGHLNKAREVTSSGPYRWIRHPLYMGSSIMGAGLAIVSANIVAAGLIAAYLVTTLTAAIQTEEAFLRAKFGDGYDRYRRGAGRTTDHRRFTVAQAVANGEHRTLLGVAVAVLLLLLKATYNGSFGWTGGP
ncbi:MAG: isoprenylcysteine carboxylmethyltransferase family protein [Acidobacteria bacterium]|nr:isoprenylcysteine carboxylmethyltransferase family protein [Acidobacteriota bacterium]